MMKRIGLVLSLVIATQIQASQLEFFDNLKVLCGQTIDGKSVFPDDPKDSFYGKVLTIRGKSCSADEIRISLQVGQDKSRTWIITNTADGLLLKHDHRHPDGTPDLVTMYGGLSDNSGDEYWQSFPADAATHQLVPEGKTNVWSLSFELSTNTFIYSLSRHNLPRFKAEFKLPKKIEIK